MKEFFDMNEPTALAQIMGRGLNVESENARQVETGGEKSKKKKRRIPRSVRELRDRDGIDPRDLLGQ